MAEMQTLHAAFAARIDAVLNALELAVETTEATGTTPSFGDSLRTALDNVNSVQAESGRLTAAYERGEETDIAKVMLARQEAGVAFEATLQVRNKLLAAYQETMRMGV